MLAAEKVVATTPYLHEMDPATGFVPADIDRKKGLELNAGYMAAKPFPHICIDGFLPPEVLQRCLDEFPSNLRSEANTFDRDQERYKSQFNPDEMNPWLRTLFYSFNSRPFIQVLQNITGIKGLIPDPYFLGAGFHEIQTGGHLGVHADFNHHKPMNLERRINVLIYLNKDWKLEYGGSLELWNDGMSSCAHKLAPEFNRCVIFNTTSESWHGNPEPVNHPQGLSRRSIALYYYTSTWSAAKRDHTTQFKVRPGTEDKTDWKVARSELIADLLPPRLYRAIKRSRGRQD
ncbi:MAG: 2OG-Fe(II) oxygenase [Phenylobacterium sp.]|uniref:2OG-Fe(II) oxygenase n=1 Tax=Phenylobacterium sp. TaxID=1871053 RepID=UPI001A641E18|nr:2OG-Fe(II) oxygenase [Phenylobacterium sp.]MBL8772693.1 2OG-Fe(II) oxygenase [Phenylobacterium sp.]